MAPYTTIRQLTGAVELVGEDDTVVLTTPMELARVVPIAVDRSIVVVRSPLRTDAFEVSDAVLQVLVRTANVRTGERADDLTADALLDAALLRLGIDDTPRPGRLAYDGAFVTVEIDGRRTHHVVAEGRLPRLRREPSSGEGGAITVRLYRPDAPPVTIVVAPEHVEETEKALVILRAAPSVAPSPPPPPRPEAGGYVPPGYVPPGHAPPPPGYGATPSGPYGSPYGPGWAPPVREHHAGTTVLVLGILSLVVCGLLGPLAWIKGNEALEDMAFHRDIAWSNRGQIVAGRICGIIATVLLGLWVAIMALFFVVAIGAASG